MPPPASIHRYPAKPQVLLIVARAYPGPWTCWFAGRSVIGTACI